MATKTQEFGIVRNGEHLERGFTTRQMALDRIVELKAQDKGMEAQGWIKNASAAVYHITEIKSKSW